MKQHCEKDETQPTKGSFFDTKPVSIKYNGHGDKLPQLIEGKEEESTGKEDEKGKAYGVRVVLYSSKQKEIDDATAQYED